MYKRDTYKLNTPEIFLGGGIVALLTLEFNSVLITYIYNNI